MNFSEQCYTVAQSCVFRGWLKVNKRDKIEWGVDKKAKNDARKCTTFRRF